MIDWKKDRYVDKDKNVCKIGLNLNHSYVKKGNRRFRKFMVLNHHLMVKFPYLHKGILQDNIKLKNRLPKK